MQRGQLRRTLRLLTLPLALGAIVACSDYWEREPVPPSLETVKDVNLRPEIAKLQAAQTSEQIKEAIDWLRLETDPQSIPFIVPFIRHADTAVALQAVETIEFLAITTTDGITVFSEALTWKLPSVVKSRIVEGLYEQRTEVPEAMPVAAPMLLVLEREPDPEVRLEAARYLGALGEVEVIPGLRERLQGEKDDRVRQTIDWSIRYIRNETSEGPPSFDVKAGT